MWFLPISLLVTATVLAIPLSRYFAWIMDGKYHPPRILRWFETRLDSGSQDWKQYASALLVFNVMLFVYGFIVLALQPVNPLNQQHKGMLAPTTIFNSVISFMTNTTSSTMRVRCIFRPSARSSSSSQTCSSLRRSDSVLWPQ